MNLRVLGCVLLCWCAASNQALAAIAYVQSAGTTGSGTSMSVAYPSNVSTGSLLITALSVGSGVSSVTDSLGQSETTLAGEITDGSTFCIRVSYYVNSAAGADTITVNFTGSAGFGSVAIHEYSGVATASALDKTTTNNQVNPGTGTDAITTGSVTTTTDGQLIFGFAAQYDSVASTTAGGTGYTERQDPFGDTPTEDRIQTSAGAIAATFTAGNASQDFFSWIATFKAAVAASGAPTRTLTGVGK